MIERNDKLLAAAVVVIAFALRLLWLDSTTLSSAEAEHGLTALALVQGHQPYQWSAPALHTVHAAVVALFGASELTLRLPGAVAGTAAVALLWLFRPLLGAAGVVTAMLLLALSPSLVQMSRTAGPEALIQPLVLVLIWCVVRSASGNAAWALNGAAVSTGLLLTLGPGAVSCLVALSLAPALAWAMGGNVTAGLRQRLPEAVVGLLLAFTLAGSGVLLHPAGFGVQSVVTWARAFEPDALAGPWSFGLLKLVAYEPPVLAAGVAVIMWGILRPSALPRTVRPLSVWAMGGTVLLAAMGDRGAWTLLPVTLPLTLLAGIGLGRLLEGLDRLAVQRAALALPVAAVLVGYLMLALLRQSGPAADASLSVAVACLALLLTSVIALLPQDGVRPLPVAGAALLAVLTIVALDLHTASRLAYAGGSGGAEWFSTPRPDGALAATLGSLPLFPRGASPHLTESGAVAVADDVGPLVRWHLRDRAAVSYVPELTPGPPLLISRLAGQGRPDVRGYHVRDFPLEVSWRPTDVTAGRLWRWFVLRETFGAPPQEARAVLYLRS